MSEVNELNEARADLIKRCGQAHNLGEDWLARMTESGDALSDDDIRQAARNAAAEKRQTRTQAQVRTTAPANDDPAQVIACQAEALAGRMSGTAPSGAARLDADGTLRFRARCPGPCWRLDEGSQHRRNADPCATYHFGIYGDHDRRRQPRSGRVLSGRAIEIARQRTLADFRTSSTLKIGESSGLEPVRESGDIKALSTGGAKEGLQLETFGGTFALSRRAIINDDLNAFARWLEMMGRAAAEAEAKQLLALLAQNGGNGPKVGEDGN